MLDYSKLKIFIFECGGRQALPACKGFSKLGCEVTAYCHSKYDTGYLTRYSKKKIICTEKILEDFYDNGAKLIKSGEYDLVVPLGDASATYLSKHKEELSKYAKIAVNDWPIFEKVIDKQNTMKVCQDNNIPSPRTILCDDILEKIDAGELQFPVVVKPRTACGSIGFNIIDSREELSRYLDQYDNVNGPILVQEYIPQDGPQYGGEVFRCKDGTYAFVLIDVKPRWYPLDGGSPTINLTVHDAAMQNTCKNLLDALNWNGYANIDFVVDARTKQAKVIEINGRLSAATKINYCVGIDVAKTIIDNEFGEKVTIVEDYPDNKGITCLLSDTLWFFKSKERFSTSPAWIKRFAMSDAIFDVSDIKPSIGFVIQSVKGYRSAMTKRKRFK